MTVLQTDLLFTDLLFIIPLSLLKIFTSNFDFVISKIYLPPFILAAVKLWKVYCISVIIPPQKECFRQYIGIGLSACVSVCVHICFRQFIGIGLSACVSVCEHICFRQYIAIGLSACVSVCVHICFRQYIGISLSACVSVCILNMTVVSVKALAGVLTVSQTCLQNKSFEHTLGKGEIACNEQFHLFSLSFLPFWV